MGHHSFAPKSLIKILTSIRTRLDQIKDKEPDLYQDYHQFIVANFDVWEHAFHERIDFAQYENLVNALKAMFEFPIRPSTEFMDRFTERFAQKAKGKPIEKTLSILPSYTSEHRQNAISPISEDVKANLKKRHRSHNFSYFCNLGVHYIGINHFGLAWSALDRVNYNVGELTDVLKNVKKFIQRNASAKAGYKLRNFALGQSHVWENAVLAKLDEIGPGLAIRLLGSARVFADMGQYPSGAFMMALEEKIISLMPEIKINGLASILQTYADMQMPPSQKLADLLLEKITQNIAQAKEIHLSRIIGAIAKLGLKPTEDFMSEWIDHFLALMPPDDESFGEDGYVSRNSLANSFWAMMFMDNANGHEVKPFAEYLHKTLVPLDEERFHEFDIHKIHQSRLYFGFQLFYVPPKEDSHEASAHEALVTEELKYNGYRVANEPTYIPEMGHFVDQTIDGTPVIFQETDGPFHYLYRPNPKTGQYEATELNPSTLVQSALMRKYRPDAIIIRLPFPVSHRITSEQQYTKAIFDSIFSQAREFGPGMYTVNFDDPDNLFVEPLPIEDNAYPIARYAEPSTYHPVTDALIDGLDIASEPDGKRIITHTPKNISLRAGFALGGVLPPLEAPNETPTPLDEIRTEFGKASYVDALLSSDIEIKNAQDSAQQKAPEERLQLLAVA